MEKQKDRLLSALGQRISFKRKQRKISLGQLATKMAISKGNLSDIEAGKRDPRFTTLRAIALGIQIPLAELLNLSKRG